MPSAESPPVAAFEAYHVALQRLREGNLEVSLPAAAHSESAALLRDALALLHERGVALDRAERLLRISELAAAGLALDETLDHIFDGFQSAIPFDRMGCALLSDDGARLTARWVRPDTQENVIRQGFSASMAGSSLRQVLRTGEPRILNDLEAYLEAHPESVTTRLIVEEGVRSSLTCPLVAMGKYLGFLFFSSREKFTYQHAHQEIFLRIATQISCLIERSRLYDRLEAMNRRLLDAQQELRRQATHDALTGIYNRRAILDALGTRDSFENCTRSPCSVIMIDVDHFKRINDRYGHQAGDSVLQMIVATLCRHVRDQDTVGRYGGEEFLVVVETTISDVVLGLAERLRRAVEEEPVVCQGESFHISISLGVGLPAAGTAPDTAMLIRSADQALYAAKARGRNCVCHALAS